jgi:hypothetical protein
MGKIAELIYGHSINYRKLDTTLNEQFVKQILQPYASRPREVEGNSQAKAPTTGEVITFSQSIKLRLLKQREYLSAHLVGRAWPGNVVAGAGGDFFTLGFVCGQ